MGKNVILYSLLESHVRWLDQNVQTDLCSYWCFGMHEAYAKLNSRSIQYIVSILTASPSQIYKKDFILNSIAKLGIVERKTITVVIKYTFHPLAMPLNIYFKVENVQYS